LRLARGRTEQDGKYQQETEQTLHFHFASMACK
jgi:hypothetical protein